MTLSGQPNQSYCALVPGGVMGIGLGFSIVFFFSFSVFASSPKCDELVADLKAMRIAQKQLLLSLSGKNEMFAMVLDQNAKKLEKTMGVRRVIKKSDLQILHVSARTFRNHQERESALVDRFEKASSDLLDQVQVCLEKKDSFAKLD